MLNAWTRIDIASAAALTGYQLKVVLPYVSGMQADYADVRFADATGANLPHYLESKTDAVTATFWVRVPALATTGTTIYALYGNSARAVPSQGAGVFDLYDDFSALWLDTSKWTPSEGRWSTIQFATLSTAQQMAAPAGLINTQGLAIRYEGATRYWYWGGDTGTGQPGTIRKFGDDGVIVSTFAGPEHCANLSVHPTRGTILASSGVTSTTVVWEIDPATGAKLRQWDFTSEALGAYSFNCAAADGNDVWILGEDAQYGTLRLRKYTLNLDGTWTAGTPLYTAAASGASGVVQGFTVANGLLLALVDQGEGSGHCLHRLFPRSDGVLVVVEKYTNLVSTGTGGGETEGLAWDAVTGAFFYGDTINAIRKITLMPNGSAYLYSNTAANEKVYFRESTTRNYPVVLEWRAKYGASAYEQVGLSDSDDPFDAPNSIIYGRASGGGANLWSVTRSAGGAKLQQSTTATADGAYHDYRIVWRSASAADFYCDGVLVKTNASNLPAVPLAVSVGGSTGGGGAAGDLTVDYVRVRKYAAVEPTLTLTTGAEMVPDKSLVRNVDDDGNPVMLGPMDALVQGTMTLPDEKRVAMNTKFGANGTAKTGRLRVGGGMASF